MNYVYLVYVENPKSGRVKLEKVCANLEVARKWWAKYEKSSFSHIETMEVEE